MQGGLGLAGSVAVNLAGAAMIATLLSLGRAGKTMRGQLCYVAAFNQYINVGFYKGIDLPDPQKLLEGTGKRMRHVKIRQAADLENPALHDLIQASLRDITAS